MLQYPTDLTMTHLITALLHLLSSWPGVAAWNVIGQACMSVQATGSHQKEQTLLYLQTDWQSKHVQTSVFAKPRDPTRCTALAASHDALMARMCRFWKQAYYNASNCEALVSCAAELQGLVLANSSLAARPTLMANLLEAVTEVKEFIATFSERSVLFMVQVSACLLACLPTCMFV